ncbi:maleylacetate reductase [Rhizobium sp. 2MFCol3.1]|uniref:maleylacetate reductase n=1 Tax=Rhizobium sp. 2MFCol3.1 TaxID=1246459 RepID=UPI000380378B|nr:maleylacetate reductase [Rhizobium sp. 2MFCol3.1]
MRSFTYTAAPARVIFGSGTIERLGDEISRLGLKRVLFLSTPHQAAFVQGCAEKVGSVSAGNFSGATMHTPFAVTERALSAASELDADGIVAIGGGSTTGLGKAIALRTDLPQIVVPTTFAGSEMTSILGETNDGRKVTVTDPRVRPEVVIYDVELTRSLPTEIAVASGMNAMAHAVEALYSQERNPVVTLMASEAIRSLKVALPGIVAGNPEARRVALYGAWLSGICLGSVPMSLHHKLCHTLGGLFDLPHADMHSILLPHVVAYNMPAVPEVRTLLGEVLDHADPARALFAFNTTLGIKRSLAEIGMPSGRIEDAVTAAISEPYWNPRALDRAGIACLLERAYAGDEPVAASEEEKSHG